MSQTSAADLERAANDLSQITKKYTDSSNQLDQLVRSLESTTSQVLYGGSQEWRGISSEAFHQAWLQRRARMQQASQLLSQGAHFLSQFAQTIEDHLPTIHRDQSLEQGPLGHLPIINDQILNEESQAQNAITMALSMLNSQLETLAEEVGDCPEEKEQNNYPGNNNISRNSSNANESGKTPEQRIEDAAGDPVLAQELIELAKQEGANLDDVATLLEQGRDPGVVAQLIERFGGDDLAKIAKYNIKLEDINLVIKSGNPQFRLTDTNAINALIGPEGTARVEVAGKEQYSDVRFYDSNGILIGRREVKCVQGKSQGSFNDYVLHAGLDQMEGVSKDGTKTILIQLPAGTTEADAEARLARMRGGDQVGRLTAEEKIELRTVHIEMIDPSGKVLLPPESVLP